LVNLKHLGKILASGALFILLGVGGLLVSLLFLPILRLLPGGQMARQRRAQSTIHHLFRAFVFGLQTSGILHLQARPLTPEELKGRLILANHPGYLDVVLILSCIPNAVCVVKEGVWNNPFFGRLIREAGFVRNLDPEQCLSDASAALRRGDPVILFPEGTRTPPGAPFVFRRGAAHLVLRSKATILPLIVTCDPPLLGKGNRWYNIPISTCQYRILAQPPLVIPLLDFLGLAPPTAARHLSKDLEAHFNRLLKEAQQGTSCLAWSRPQPADAAPTMETHS
jgi:1-acyl-sn-glycerol-3-phosphate acyltransferase